MGSWVILALLVVMVEAASINLREASPSSGWEDVVLGAGHVLERYLEGCHVVLVAPHHSSVLASLLRFVIT